MFLKGQSFIYSPSDALVSSLKQNNTKIYIKIYIKTTPTCFRCYSYSIM